MPYEPTNWQTGDIITAEKLNNIEDGIASMTSLVIHNIDNLPIPCQDDGGDGIVFVKAPLLPASNTQSFAKGGYVNFDPSEQDSYTELSNCHLYDFPNFNPDTVSIMAEVDGIYSPVIMWGLYAGEPADADSFESVPGVWLAENTTILMLYDGNNYYCLFPSNTAFSYIPINGDQ